MRRCCHELFSLDEDEGLLLLNRNDVTKRDENLQFKAFFSCYVLTTYRTRGWPKLEIPKRIWRSRQFNDSRVAIAFRLSTMTLISRTQSRKKWKCEQIFVFSSNYEENRKLIRCLSLIMRSFGWRRRRRHVNLLINNHFSINLNYAFHCRKQLWIKFLGFSVSVIKFLALDSVENFKENVSPMEVKLASRFVIHILTPLGGRENPSFEM